MGRSPSSSASAGGRDPGRDLAQERMALDLTRRGERELRKQLETLRQLVGSDTVAQKGDEALERRRRAGARHQAQAVALAEPRIGNADDGGIEHLRMGVENFLDLAREELLAAAVDHLLQAPDDAEIAVGVD